MLFGKISRLLTSLFTQNGFITVPGFIALALWVFTSLTLWLDGTETVQALALSVFHGWMPYSTALSVLGTIAGAAITTLSLVYSLVLVVFTLAAGTIAPRLLRRFTNDRVSQMTAGLLGGTFLFALTVLSATNEDFVPQLSAAIAIGLAALSVLQLIYFVHSVSVNVMIDEEVAAISAQLKEKLRQIVDEDEASKRAEWPDQEAFAHVIESRTSGFLSLHDPQALVKFAEEKALKIELCASPGDFVIEGEHLARIAWQEDELSGEELEKLEEDLCELLELTSAGEDYRGVVFSINLLLEITLRALSPGVNDTFTAISSVNRLTECLVLPVSCGIRENIRLDDEGEPRLRVPGLTLEDLLLKSFQPIRLSAADNHLMLVSLAAGYRRLHAVARDRRGRDLISSHAEALIATYKQTDPLPQDLDDLERHLATVLRKAS